MRWTRVAIPVVVLVVLGVAGGWLVYSRGQKEEKRVLGESVVEALPIRTTTVAGPVAILEIFFGKVEVKLPSSVEFVEGKDGQEIPVKTMVRTGGNGRGQILYPNHSVTRLDFNSTVEVEELGVSPNKMKIKLDAGRIWSRVAKLLGQDNYQTNTDGLVASVRGTSFGQGLLDGGRGRLVVTEGKVGGECTNKTQSEELAITQQAIFDCMAGKKAQVSFLSAKDRLDEWYVFNNQQDRLLDERFGGATYGVTPTPIPTKKVMPTPTPTASNAATPTSTPTPTPRPEDDQPLAGTPTPTPSPTATPTPSPTPSMGIKGVSTPQSCYDGQSCRVQIDGWGLKGTTLVVATDTKGNAVSRTDAVEVISDSQITADFGQLVTGDYKVKIGEVLSPNSFTVQQVFLQ